MKKVRTEPQRFRTGTALALLAFGLAIVVPSNVQGSGATTPGDIAEERELQSAEELDVVDEMAARALEEAYGVTDLEANRRVVEQEVFTQLSIEASELLPTEYAGA